MRKIRHTTQFKRDFKREKAGRHRQNIEDALWKVVKLLATDKPLPLNNADHPLAGDWSDHRDCHIKPDLILIYRKPDDLHLDLVRLGSHAKLGF